MLMSGWHMLSIVKRRWSGPAAGIERVFSLLPGCASGRVEVCPRSAAEVAFLLHGLEFARVRQGLAANSFARQDEITFGAGANETALTEETEELFTELVGGCWMRDIRRAV